MSKKTNQDRNSETLIKEVYSDNFTFEMERIRGQIHKYPFIAMVIS